MKILNLYAGIGGNRKLWGDKHEITAVENNPEIAKIYQDFFPKDKVIVCDAHQYLLEHYKEFDFIWSSPPCPSHSKMNFLHQAKGLNMKFPDMKLYEEVIFLNQFFKGRFVIENVKGYYTPLIEPQESERHYFWANFEIPNIICTKKVRNDKGMTLKVKMQDKDIIINNFYNYEGDKRTLINNAIEPQLGLVILNQAELESEVKG
jgi:DNA (cytosine-5)-methyltransferase 1